MQAPARFHPLFASLKAPRSAAEWAMLVSFGVYCFVFPFATFLMSFDLMPFGMEWMSSLLLAMLGLAAGAWLVVNFGCMGLIISLALFATGVALEYTGVNTGRPFGAYRYTGVLIPELPGGVPLAIGFAWLLIVVAGLFTARQLLAYAGRGLSNRWLVAAVGAALAVGLDLLLEPVAVHVKGYWQWLAGSGGYYGVPWSNFATWLVAALLMNACVLLLLRKEAGTRWGWLPTALFGMNVVMFGLVNVAHSFWVAGAVGLVLLVLLLMLVPAIKRQSSPRSL